MLSPKMTSPMKRVLTAPESPPYFLVERRSSLISSSSEAAPAVASKVTMIADRFSDLDSDDLRIVLFLRQQFLD
jgi:hypothetical protein